MTVKRELIGEGGVRPAHSRWVITGTLVLDSAAQFGGQSSSDSIDMVLLRDESTGMPMISGTSLTGILRSYLVDTLHGFHSAEKKNTSTIFGSIRTDNSGGQSPCFVFDSIQTQTSSITVEIRDFVRIYSSSATADGSGKFDMEIIPAGACFPLRIEVLIPSEDDETGIISHLFIVLEGLEHGEISLGAKTTRGLGRCHVSNWRVIRYDFSSRQGWMNWLQSDHLNPTHDMDPFDNIIDALSATWPFEVSDFNDKRNKIVINLDLQIKSGMLVGSQSSDSITASNPHITSGGLSIIPGSSFAGVLRQRTYGIIQILSESSETANKWVDEIFGPELVTTDQTQNFERRERASELKSRIRVYESWIDGGVRFRTSRLRLDKFLGNIIRMGLSGREPHYKGGFRFTIELRNPCEGELGLLLLLTKDLISGTLPIGSNSSVGQGFVTGSAMISGSDKALLGCGGILSEKSSTVNREDANKAVQKLVTRLRGGI